MPGYCNRNQKEIIDQNGWKETTTITRKLAKRDMEKHTPDGINPSLMIVCSGITSVDPRFNNSCDKNKFECCIAVCLCCQRKAYDQTEIKTTIDPNGYSTYEATKSLYNQESCCFCCVSDYDQVGETVTTDSRNTKIVPVANTMEREAKV